MHGIPLLPNSDMASTKMALKDLRLLLAKYFLSPCGLSFIYKKILLFSSRAT
jgi:hypothetical protein